MGRTSDTKNEYMLGSSDEELARLGFQHKLWSESAFALWERVKFPFGGKLLELGCGPGFTTLDLSVLVGESGSVIAVDQSQKYLAYLRHKINEQSVKNIQIVESDISNLSLQPNSLDGAYARWVFCYLADPLAVIKNIVPALRPGGKIAITDYFNYRAYTLAPGSKIFDQVIEVIQLAWRSHSGSLEIAGALPGYMIEAGLKVEEFKPNYRVAKPNTPLWNWLASFLRIFLPKWKDEGLLDQNLIDNFWQEWERRSGDPGTHLCLPPMWDVVGVKPG